MRIFLSGPMGSGKSTLAAVVGELAGLPAFDLDRLITERAGCEIPELFRRHGEAAFRSLEREVLEAVLAEQAQCVLALGGGTVADAESRRRLLAAGTLITLDAPLPELVRRVGEARDRPLLSGGDVHARLSALLADRAAAYAECHARVTTADRAVAELAREVLAVAEDAPIVVPLGLRSYRVEIGAGVRRRLRARVEAMCAGAVLVVNDVQVDHLAREAREALLPAGRAVVAVELPSGEQHKTLQTVQHIWQRALDAQLDRGSGVLGIGGGVTGDLAGFAAATLLRGVPVGHMPTTLLAMVDSAVGGKTGFDTEHGKNLIGAFHQPSFVLCDVEVLATLPVRERIAGLAEVVKSAWIEGESAVAELERDCEALAAGDPEATVRAVRMSAAMKAAVVTQDERESGRRAVLNLGHTVGHAIEASLGYQELRHGEAVALGMVAAFRLSHARGVASADDVERGQRLLERLGLPTDLSRYLDKKTLSYMASDKKRRRDRLTYVVPGAPGDVRLESLSLAELEAALTAGRAAS